MCGNMVRQMLALDVHKPQKIQAVKDTMYRMNTLPVMMPAGYTSLVQPLDISNNKPFKDQI